MSLDINENKKTYFQIRPNNDNFWDYNVPVMFCNEAFSIGDIERITAVYMIAPLLYQFKVYLNKQAVSDDVITFDFDRKAEALTAQRELARAYTKSGEYSEQKDVSTGAGPKAQD